MSGQIGESREIVLGESRGRYHIGFRPPLSDDELQLLHPPGDVPLEVKQRTTTTTISLDKDVLATPDELRARQYQELEARFGEYAQYVASRLGGDVLELTIKDAVRETVFEGDDHEDSVKNTLESFAAIRAGSLESTEIATGKRGMVGVTIKTVQEEEEFMESQWGDRFPELFRWYASLHEQELDPGYAGFQSLVDFAEQHPDYQGKHLPLPTWNALGRHVFTGRHAEGDPSYKPGYFRIEADGSQVELFKVEQGAQPSPVVPFSKDSSLADGYALNLGNARALVELGYLRQVKNFGVAREKFMLDFFDHMGVPPSGLNSENNH